MVVHKKVRVRKRRRDGFVQRYWVVLGRFFKNPFLITGGREPFSLSDDPAPVSYPKFEHLITDKKLLESLHYPLAHIPTPLEEEDRNILRSKYAKDWENVEDSFESAMTKSGFKIMKDKPVKYTKYVGETGAIDLTMPFTLIKGDRFVIPKDEIVEHFKPVLKAIETAKRKTYGGIGSVRRDVHEDFSALDNVLRFRIGNLGVDLPKPKSVPPSPSKRPEFKFGKGVEVIK